MQQRILVTGANGHVGQACVRDLLQNGYNVRASVRDIKNAEKTAGLSDLDIDIVEADLFDQESLDRACDGCDSVFQLAAIYEFFSNADESIHSSNIAKHALVHLLSTLRLFPPCLCKSLLFFQTSLCDVSEGTGYLKTVPIPFPD